MTRLWERPGGALASAFRASGLRLPEALVRRPWLAAAGAFVFLPVALIYVWLLFLPLPLGLRWRDPSTTSFMEYRQRQARREGKELTIDQSWVPLDWISPNLRRAVTVAEDDRFYQHKGIDWRALAEEVDYQGDTIFSWWSAADRRALRQAAAYAWTQRAEVKGRSTITQQLAKNLYFTPRRSLGRKVAEALVARRLELFLSKDRILELYLNVAEWGPGTFGAEAAARTYFGRRASELTLGQAASLAATLPHPLTSNPAHRPAQMEWRRALILSRLRGPGERVDAAVSAPPPDTAPPSQATDTAASAPSSDTAVSLPLPDTAVAPLRPDTAGPPTSGSRRAP